jgi:hypothetical protein
MFFGDNYFVDDFFVRRYSLTSDSNPIRIKSEGGDDEEEVNPV